MDTNFTLTAAIFTLLGFFIRHLFSISARKREEKKYIHPTPSQKEVAEEIQRTERHVYTHIDDWDQVELKHPLFKDSPYLYSLIPVLEKLEFVTEVFIASNGVLRVCVKDDTEEIQKDIGILPSHYGKITLMRDHREWYKDMEDEILDTIMEHANKIIQSCPKERF